MIGQHKDWLVQGFTLIEVLVSITIVAVLMGVGLVSFRSATVSARDARRKADIETVRQALVLYRSDTGCYPRRSGANLSTNYTNMVTTLSTVVGSQYLSSPLPQDPKNSIDGSSYRYDTTGTCNTSYASTFTLSATLENGTTYTVNNP